MLKQEFIAPTTVTQCCSDAYAKRLYKLKKRNGAISRAKIQTAVKQKPGAYITEDQVRAIQAKEWLTLKEAAMLLNVSPLTLRRWVLAGKVTSRKVGRSICLSGENCERRYSKKGLEVNNSYFSKKNIMTKDAKVFVIYEKRNQALADAMAKRGCFSNELDWAINIREFQLFVLSVSESIDNALMQQYDARPLSETDHYRIELKNRRNIHLGDPDLTIFLDVSQFKQGFEAIPPLPSSATPY